MNPWSMLEVAEAEAVAILRPLKCRKRKKDFGQNLAVVAVGKDCLNLNCRYFAYSWKKLLSLLKILQ